MPATTATDNLANKLVSLRQRYNRALVGVEIFANKADHDHCVWLMRETNRALEIERARLADLVRNGQPAEA